MTSMFSFVLDLSNRLYATTKHTLCFKILSHMTYVNHNDCIKLFVGNHMISTQYLIILFHNLIQSIHFFIAAIIYDLLAIIHFLIITILNQLLKEEIYMTYNSCLSHHISREVTKTYTSLAVGNNNSTINCGLNKINKRNLMRKMQ